MKREPPPIRKARDDDAEGIISLIGGVFAEYEGVILDVDGEAPELRRIASWAADAGGDFWVAERTGRIVGTCGLTPAKDPRGIELRKLYVHRSERESGLGSLFAARCEAAARSRGASFVELWSDVKFVTAHRFYERRGYLRGPATRELGDVSATVELYFRKELA